MRTSLLFLIEQLASRLFRLLPIFLLMLSAGTSAENYSPSEKREAENAVSRERFVLHPHRRNFFLPASVANTKNGPYRNTVEDGEYHDAEIVFQISLKYLLIENWLREGLDLHTGFTSESWWQAYNADFSRPFRETNYQPEIFLSYTKPWQLGNQTVEQVFLSLNHQSNGQSSALSRSWNRLIAGLVFNPDPKMRWQVQGWWRIPESEKQGPLDPTGDDNPDIERYLGHGQLDMDWKRSSKDAWSLSLRHNLRKNQRGAIEIGYTHHLRPGVNLFLNAFHGYGDSLIYYNQSIQRFSIGFEFDSER